MDGPRLTAPLHRLRVLRRASLGLVYGSLYQSHTLPLEILVTGAFISTLAGPVAATQVSLGQTRLLVYNNAISGGIDIALSLALIPSMGSRGPRSRGRSRTRSTRSSR